MAEPQVHQNIACTGCGCVCDDLQLTVTGHQIVHTKGACSLVESWFLNQHTHTPAATQLEGSPIDYQQAVTSAADLLRDARFPLIYGLSRSSTKGQQAAVHLADNLGACIDTTASTCHAPSIMAIQQVGESTATLGEVKNRSDLVIYWGCDPSTSHPRHLERYAGEPAGLFIPHGRADRHIVVIDHKETASTQQADEAILIPKHSDFEVIALCRLLLAGKPVPDVPSLPMVQLRQLVQRMSECQSGVIFFGLGLARRGLGHRNVEVLLRLVAELNAKVPFYARRMRIPGDVTGADSVLCWQTGFPFAVSLNRGYPQYNPGEFSATDLLERQEPDVCLLVGSEGVTQLSLKAQRHLQTIPTIVLDYPTEQPLFTPTVRFTTGIYGIEHPGTVYRMDEVPLDLRAITSPRYRADHEVLDDIRRAVR